MKNLITVLLLLFVTTSIVYLVVSEVRSKPITDDSAGAGMQGGTNAAIADNAKLRTRPEQPSERPAPTVIAYYFHGTSRCPTCLKIERYTREAIGETYQPEGGRGRVRWEAVNYDEPANEHFVKEYELYASALVVVSDGASDKRTWKKLERIWELVGDEEAFKRYVIDEVTDMLRSDS